MFMIGPLRHMYSHVRDRPITSHVHDRPIASSVLTCSRYNSQPPACLPGFMHLCLCTKSREIDSVLPDVMSRFSYTRTMPNTTTESQNQSHCINIYLCICIHLFKHTIRVHINAIIEPVCWCPHHTIGDYAASL